MRMECGGARWGGFCAGQTWSDRISFVPCSRKGKYEEDGKLWCFQHRPSAVKARDEARRKQWEEEAKADEKRWARDARIREAEGNLIDGCLAAEWDWPPGLEWLARLIQEVRDARAS